MNIELLLTLGLGLMAGVVVVALVLRRRHRSVAPARPAAREPAAMARPAVLPQAGRGAGVDASPSALDQVNAQRQVATEALRLARQRKADEAARLLAERGNPAPSQMPERTAPRPQGPTQAQPARRMQPLPPSTAQPIEPAERPLLSPLAISTATPAAATKAPGLAPLRGAATPRPPLVLLADDSKVVRTKTGRLLEKQGWQVLLAEDGTAALQALETHAPDLLITDVEMPGLDGFELTRRVRAHARLARLPVIMITSSDERHRAEAHAAGVNLLLGKPYAEETLLAQVQVMLAAAAQRSGASLTLH